MRWVDGKTRGLWFEARKHRTPPRLIVLHWTGGERLAEGVFQTLSASGYSCHVILEPDGTAVQVAALDSQTDHATRDGSSIGVEIVGPGHNAAKFERPVMTEEIHGREVRYHGFTRAQMSALPAVLARISGATGIPLKAIPSSTVLPDEVLANHRGVVGHYQLVTSRNDPGPHLIRWVSELGAKASALVGLLVLGVLAALLLSSSACGATVASERERSDRCQAEEAAIEAAYPQCRPGVELPPECADAFAAVDAVRRECDAERDGS